MRLINDTIELFLLLNEGDRLTTYDREIYKTISYVVDRLHDQPYLSFYLNEWMCLLKNGKYNAFIFDLYSTASTELNKDNRLNPTDKTMCVLNIQKMLKAMYDNENITIIPQMLPSELIPRWYFDLEQCFYGFINKPRRILVADYLIKNYLLNVAEAIEVVEYLFNYPSIFEEFHFYAKNNRFKRNYCCSWTVNNTAFTAQSIHEETSLSPLDSYLFLIALKENPEEMFEKYAEGKLTSKYIEKH